MTDGARDIITEVASMQRAALDLLSQNHRFTVLGPTGNLVFYSFTLVYKRDPRGMRLLMTSPLSFYISRLRVVYQKLVFITIIK
jgi:hypothetical protein